MGSVSSTPASTTAFLAVNVISETQENVDDNINRALSDEEDTSFCGTSSSKDDFMNYSYFLLNPYARGGPEINIADDVKLCCLFTMVQFLHQEKTVLKEAHEAEMMQMQVQTFNRYESVQTFYKAKIRELNGQLQEVSKDNLATQCQLRDAEDAINQLKRSKKRAQMRQVELDEKMTKIPKANKSQDVKTRDKTATEADLESELRRSQEASNQEVQRLKLSIQEKDRALENFKLETSQVKSKCEKVETQLAQIEQKAAEGSLTSGSYADDRANASTLEDACKNVDKTTDSLIRILHERSITSNSSADMQDALQSFFIKISPACLSNFSRHVQMKYAWGHWICGKMFRGFEHVFFDVDVGSMTSLLDPKKDALECFQRFQQRKHMPSSRLCEECLMFRAFCDKMYASVFPEVLIEHHGFYHQSTDKRLIYDGYGQFNYDNEIHHLFLDVAKAIWLLHELAFSFDPPATILRMATGFQFNKECHESVIHDVDSSEMLQTVLLMIRPAFRLRDTVIRSRVFLLASSHVDTSCKITELEATSD